MKNTLRRLGTPHDLNKFEKALWALSLAAVTLSFLLCGAFDPLTLLASLIGVTALIFVAKGLVLGQILTVVFAVLYGVISFRLRYYGEMITYLGMTSPIAILAVASWLRHPFQKTKTVAVHKLGKAEIARLLILTVIVTAAFFFLLRRLGNARLAVSTVSIATSFLASALTLKRSAAYGLAYAANDVVLLVLWILASVGERAYVPMVVCFFMFLCNDLYGFFFFFFNWLRLRSAQKADISAAGDA